MISNPTWYALHAKLQQERLCADALVRRGFAAYLPMKTVRIRHARRVQTVSRPLFGRYLFVGTDVEAPRFSDIRKSLGVEWIIQNGQAPVAIKPGLIEAIQGAELAGAFDETTQKPIASNPTFAVGDSVRITAGPFADLIARIIAMPSERRAEVLLESIGHRARVVVSVARIEKNG